MEDQEIYLQVGEDGFRKLVAAFYRQIPGDEILGSMYPIDDLEGAAERLSDFLIFRFGGPALYIQRRGHPRLRMRHAPFLVDQSARDRWMQLMNNALAETQVPEPALSRLHEFFESTATFMINRME